jgi:phage/conjugal plasmid C-4 type zinc finger TraR family protein
VNANSCYDQGPLNGSGTEEDAMAGGWARDGAVQDQIDASVEDAVKRARGEMPRGVSLTHCMDCEAEIPPARRDAIHGVRRCVSCQALFDHSKSSHSGYNRRGSKDSQLR